MTNAPIEIVRADDPVPGHARDVIHAVGAHPEPPGRAGGVPRRVPPSISRKRLRKVQHIHPDHQYRPDRRSRDDRQFREAVRTEIINYGATRFLSWAIRKDGDPRYDGYISVDNFRDDSAEFTDCTVQRVVGACILQLRNVLALPVFQPCRARKVRRTNLS